jgi:AcrR family transcriptional regulator
MSSPEAASVQTLDAPADPPAKTTKGQRTRERILEAAFRLFGEWGYQSVSLRDIAADVGVTHVTVLHYFSSKEELLSDLMVQRDDDERRAAAVFLEGDHDADPHYRGLRTPAMRWYMHRIQHNDAEQGATPLFLRISTEAVTADHPAHEHFVQRYARLKDLLARALAEELAHRPAGAGTLDPIVAAEHIIALTDGVPFQSAYNPAHTQPTSALVWEYLRLIGVADAEAG